MNEWTCNKCASNRTNLANSNAHAHVDEGSGNSHEDGITVFRGKRDSCHCKRGNIISCTDEKREKSVNINLRTLTFTPEISLNFFFPSLDATKQM